MLMLIEHHIGRNGELIQQRGELLPESRKILVQVVAIVAIHIDV
jgi:hypothetical protein